ncbi:hypothetical protein N9I32_01205 [Porticoccaceae bacterium]|nr:hypothetical protein [Porticoccaceae bacterium]
MFAGGLKSVYKEVNRLEKKLKDEHLLSKHEELFFSFKDGVVVHDKYDFDSKLAPLQMGKYRILLSLEQEKIWSGEADKDEVKKFINEETIGIDKALKFYKSKPFKLEQMNASGRCLKQKDIDSQQVIVSYSSDLVSLHHMSDVYDSRNLLLSSIKNQGFNRVSLSAIDFNPETDMQEFKELKITLKSARKDVWKLVRDNSSLKKCYKLFDFK